MLIIASAREVLLLSMALQEINLLPPERRRRVRNESIAVSVTVIIKSINAGLLLMTTFSIAIVLSILLYSWAATPTTQEELNKTVDEYQALRDKVAEENAVLERLEGLGHHRIIWSDMLAEFFRVTPPGITLNRLGGAAIFGEGVVTSGTLTFMGQAITRTSLTVYEDRLKTLPGVTQVNAPASNLLERTNPTFQFNLTVAPLKN